MNEIERAINLISEGEIDYSGIYDCELNERVTEVILNALREKAEREKGCSFCCYQEYPDKTLYPKEGYAFYAGFSKQIDVDDFDEIEIDEIKYCPICSRRLEVGHE